MARILITSGPTREYLDPVRYLSNGSSGRMGAALASAAIEAGHRVVVVSGPVEIVYPAEAEVIRVVSTEEMLSACQKVFPDCDGLVAVAAPCDYRPKTVAKHKIKKDGKPLPLELIETPDIVAGLSAMKNSQWIVGFALETEDQHLHAMQKLERKSCDLIVVNGPHAMHATDTQVEVLNRQGESVGSFTGGKSDVARQIMAVIASQLMHA
jgi:phosphopantothenoylcysteine decarboxylase/phosphopantothenate--cysteine ligase